MPDLERALTDIDLIRGQLARVSEFRGFGPASLALTGVLAFATAAAQSLWLKDPGAHVYGYVGLWVATAACAVLVIGIEAAARARRAHGRLATPMLQTVVEQFLPSMVAGALVTGVCLQGGPHSLWMLPGLWQIIFGLGAFATSRVLPRPMMVVGGWYLACGLACLELGRGGHAFSPWAMGVPFGVGQWLVAGILRMEREDGDA